MLLLLAGCAFISQQAYDERLDPDGDGFPGVTAGDEDCAPFDPTLPAAWYPDIDRDGYGTEGEPVWACVAPYGTAASTDDCDDSRADVNPGATEVCDSANLDEDCSGLADDEDPGVDPASLLAWYADLDGDGHPGDLEVVWSCEAPAGYAADPTDCDDADPRVWPGNEEVCGDGIDNDCDERTRADCRLDGAWEDADATLTLTGDSDGGRAGSSVALLEGAAGGGVALLALATGDAGLATVHLVRGDATGDHRLDESGYDARVVVTTAWDRVRTTVSAPTAWADWAAAPLTIGVVPGESALEPTGPGAIYLLEAPGDGTTDLTDVAPLFLGVEADGAGSIALATGDVDADGYVDLLVPAPDHTGGEQGQGAVWLIRGDGTGAAPAQVDAQASSPFVVGDNPGDRLGAAVTVADLDGDGADDVLIGAPGHDGLYDGAEASGAGIVYLLEGPIDPDLTLTGLDRNPVLRMYGEAAHLRTGTEQTLAAGEDVDGDGYADLVIGAPSTQGTDNGGTPYSTSGGRVYFVRGGDRVLAGSLEYATGVFSGELDEDRIGAVVSFLGDLDGDGAPDLALGSSRYDRGRDVVTDADDGDNAGGVWVLYGPTLAGSFTISEVAQLTILGAEGDGVGAALAGGDADGDGVDDLLIGARGRGTDAGGASLWLGARP